MDEIGRGTSTYDGLSIAWAVVEYLHDYDQAGVKTLFATHYHELVELAGIKARVRNFNIAVKEWGEKIIFLRKLIPGGTNRSYGIQVARLAGIPEILVQRAKEILSRIEDHAPDGSRVGESLSTSGNGIRKPIQLDLFRSMENEIIAQLTRVDVNGTTPMEALALLQKLQETIQKAGD
jgi:DNA mismatch repair protein MutS